MTLWEWFLALPDQKKGVVRRVRWSDSYLDQTMIDLLVEAVPDLPEELTIQAQFDNAISKGVLDSVLGMMEIIAAGSVRFEPARLADVACQLLRRGADIKGSPYIEQ